MSQLPNLQEVFDAIKQVKAPGKDSILPEIFKYGGQKLAKNCILFLYPV